MFNFRSSGLISKGSSFLRTGTFSLRRHKSNGINVSNYETGFNAGKVPQDKDLVDELDLLSLNYDHQKAEQTAAAAVASNASSSSNSNNSNSRMQSSGDRRNSPNRSVLSKYPTGGVAKMRCYNCGQIGHVSFDCQQPQVRKACYTCGNSGHLARDCPQSQRPMICYVCRQPGHLASKCPSSSNGQYRSKTSSSNNNNNQD